MRRAMPAIAIYLFWGRSTPIHGSTSMVAVKYDELFMALEFVCSGRRWSTTRMRSIQAKSIGLLISTTTSTKTFLTTLRLRTATLRYRIRTSSALAEISPSDSSHKSCLSVTKRLRGSSDGGWLTHLSNICWSAKAFLSSGIRLKPTRSKEP